MTILSSIIVIYIFKIHEKYAEHDQHISFIGLFWSLTFDLKTRLILVSTKPTPHARHIVCEPQRLRISEEGHSSEDGNQAIPNAARRATSYAVTGKIEFP